VAAFAALRLKVDVLWVVIAGGVVSVVVGLPRYVRLFHDDRARHARMDAAVIRIGAGLGESEVEGPTLVEQYSALACAGAPRPRVRCPNGRAWISLQEPLDTTAILSHCGRT
jgi:hypothetical protein